MKMSERNMLDVLLANDIPEPRTKGLKIKRLSEAFGEDFVVEIKELTYSKVDDLQKKTESDVHTVLAGVTNIDFKNAELKAKYDAETPAELVKKVFQPGEITSITREIERLSGYRTATWEDVKKN